MCTGGDSGLAYNASGGALTVNLNNDPITGHAVNISDDGGARDIVVNNGLPSASYVAAPILATDSGNFAVKLQSSGGNVQFTSYAGGSVVYSGAGTSGAAVAALTSGSGTVAITTNDVATDLSGIGIGGLSVNGAVNIWANAAVNAGSDAIYASTSGTGNVTVVTGSASNPVAVSTTNSAVHDAVNASSVGGNVSVTTFGLSTGELLAQAGGGGNVTITANGDVTASGGNAAIYAASANGNIAVTTNGNLTDSLAALSSGSGNITITANGNITEPDTYSSIYAAGSGGNVVVTTNGNLTNGMSATTLGSGTVTVTANGNIANTQSFNSLYAAGVNGNVSVAVNSASITGVIGTDSVEADTSGAGNVAVTLGNGVTIGSPTVGVYAQSFGGISTVTTGNNVTITAADAFNAGAITAKSALAPTAAAFTTFVTTGTGNTFTVTGDKSAGITAVNQGYGLGGVSVATGSGNAITVTGDDAAAILATTTDNNFTTDSFDGAGNVTVNIGAKNTLLVNAGSGSGTASGGVVAATDGGNVDLEWTGAGGSVTVNGAPGIATVGVLALSGPGPGGASTSANNPQTLTLITGNGTAITSNNGLGIVAANINFGQTTVTSNGPISANLGSGASLFSDLLSGVLGSNASNILGGGIVAVGQGPTVVTSNAAISVIGGDGIDALGGMSLAVTNNAAVTADHYAINAISLGNITIINSATIIGAGSIANPVIGISAVGTTTITNGAGGLIRSAAGSPSDLAIAATTFDALSSSSSSVGPVALVNNGAIKGRLDLSIASGATFTNAGTWTTSGTSKFSSGTNSLSNTGTILTSGTTTFSALQTFTNTGLLDMHSGSAAAGDVTVVSGTFAGGSGSKLAVELVPRHDRIGSGVWRTFRLFAGWRVERNHEHHRAQHGHIGECGL